MPTEATATVESAPAAEATPAAPTAPAEGAPAATPDAVPPPVEAPKERDEIAESLAALNRELRSAKSERDKYKGESAKLAERVTLAEVTEKASAAIKSKDFVTALRTLDPDLSVDEAIVTLLEQAAALDQKPMSQADIEKMVAAKIEADKKESEEKAKAAEEAAKRANADALELSTRNYLVAVGAEQQTGAFPLVNAHSTTEEEVEALEKMIRRHTQERFAESREIPTPRQSLEWLERKFEADLKAVGYTKAQIAEIKADAAADGKAKATGTVPTADTLGAAPPPPEKGKRESMKEYDARVKAQFRALRQQSAH